MSPLQGELGGSILHVSIFYPDWAQSEERMAEDHVDADRNRESGLKQSV